MLLYCIFPILSPFGKINVCSYLTSNTLAIIIISSKETVPRFSFLLKFCGVCPMRLHSSARLIFFCLHNCRIISDVVIVYLPFIGSIANQIVDRNNILSSMYQKFNREEVACQFVTPSLPNSTSYESIIALLINSFKISLFLMISSVLSTTSIPRYCPVSNTSSTTSSVNGKKSTTLESNISKSTFGK